MTSDENWLDEEIKRVLALPKPTRKEIKRLIKEEKRKRKSPEVIDKEIEIIEKPGTLDGIIGWQGVMFNSSEWEAYKVKVGYYERHPERKEESQAFSKMLDVLQEEIEQKSRRGTENE